MCFKIEKFYKLSIIFGIELFRNRNSENFDTNFR